MMSIMRKVHLYLSAAICCIYLFGGGFLRRKNRSLMKAICTHFSIPTWPYLRIPKVELTELAGGNIPVTLLESEKTSGNVGVHELVAINQLVGHRNPGCLFELGTFDGRTTLNMSANCGPHAEVYTLDLPSSRIDQTALPIHPSDRKHIEKDMSGTRYLGTPYESKIVQLYGDTATFDFTPFFNNVDFVFVDASHSYEYVLNDSLIALRLLRGGKGMILWHDYGAPGVTRALNQLCRTDPRFESIKHISGTSLACLQLSGHAA